MADEQDQDYLAGVDNVHASFSMDGLSQAVWPSLAECGWADLGLWLLRRRSRHRIEGRSMLPTLRPGDEVLYAPKIHWVNPPTVGAVVIVQHPHQPALVMIKRVVAIEGNAEKGLQAPRYWLLGDNPEESTDSRSFGWVAHGRLMGTVVCMFYQQP